MSAESRLVVVRLFEKLPVITAGNLFIAPAYLDVDASRFRPLLPYCSGITLLTLTENATSNFRWNLYFYSGYTRESELSGGPTALAPSTIQGPGATSAESKRFDVYDTLTSFLLESRLVLGYGNNAFSGTPTPAVLSATLLLTTMGM